MKHLPIIKYALLGVSTLLFLIWVAFQPLESVDAQLYWCYGVLALSLLLIIVLPMINMVQNPKAAVRSMLGFGLVVVVCLISYALGDGSPVVNSGGGFFENAAVNKMTDAGIYLTYVALVATIFVAIFGEIRNSFK